MTAPAEELANGAGALDLLLSDAALGSWRRFLPWTPGLRMTAALFRIAAGRSHIAAPPRDRRFAEPAWTDNPALRAVMQAYLVTSDTAQRLVREVDLPWRDAERLRFVVDNLVDAPAPSNVAALYPLWWKALIDTGGRSAVRGACSLVRDLAQAPRVPSMVDVEQFRVGQNLAATPGAVVFRNPVMELIQYAPTTSEVARTPLLIVPPMINKYYIVDLAPGRSLIEYLRRPGAAGLHDLVAQPGRAPPRLGLRGLRPGAARRAGRHRRDHRRCADTPAEPVLGWRAVRDGRRASRRGRPTGAGRQLRSGRRRARSVPGGTAAALADERMAGAAVAASRSKGYLDGSSLAEIFAWLRPGDLIWNYWVNNYLRGRRPAAFDILYWNVDTTRMTAALHRDFIDLFHADKLSEPGSARILGSPVGLFAVKADAYVVAGIADHLCPWQACYRSTQLLGGSSRFILSTSGHIACLVNPPVNPKASYRVSETTPPDTDAWLHAAATETGSWWADYAAWLGERAGGWVPAPSALGNDDHPPLEPAPGTYVYDR